MDCPCTSGKPAAECCDPIMNGQPAPTAEALMRARYTAYATGNVEFIRDSHVASHRHEVDLNSVREWSQAADWKGMEVVAKERGEDGDTDGVVEFKARYELQGQVLEHHEIAEFKIEDEGWKFVDGYEPRQEPFVRTERKVRPNEPCPCGSGKKFKKCCGKPGAVAS